MPPFYIKLEVIMSEQQYLELVEKTISSGFKSPLYCDPDGYTLVTFGASLKFDLADGFPIFTTKKVNYINAFKEILWFLSGTGNVAELHRQGCKIWDDWGVKLINHRNRYGNPITLEKFQTDCDKESYNFFLPLHYTNFTKWENTLDQTKWVIDRIRKEPYRRDCVVTLWNPMHVYDTAFLYGYDSVILPACYYAHQLVVTDRLNMVVTGRSNDAGIGTPFNVAQYALLLHMYSHCLGIPVGELQFNVGNFHVYWNHIDPFQKQLQREPYDFPEFVIKDRGQKYLTDFTIDDFDVVNYQSHSFIKFPITVVGGY
jgi:thymidylate synthase